MKQSMLRTLAMLMAVVVFMMGLPFAALAEEVNFENLIVAAQDVVEEEAPAEEEAPVEEEPADEDAVLEEIQDLVFVPVEEETEEEVIPEEEVVIEELDKELEVTGPEIISVGQSSTLKLYYNGKKVSSNTKAKWYTSDSSILKVSSAGKVTAKGVGYATITATYKGEETYYQVNVLPKTTSIVLTDIYNASYQYDQKTTYKHDFEYRLNVKAVVEPAAARQDVKWSTSDKKIATVTDGEIVFKKPGKVTITASAKDGSGKKCVLKLQGVRVVETITISGKTELTQGQSTTLKAAVSPSNASIKTVTWTSSNTSLATVDSKGVVKAVKSGYTTRQTVCITATAKDGSGVVANHYIDICPAATSVSVYWGSANLTGGNWKYEYNLEDGDNVLDLSASVYPAAASQAVTWKSSNTKIATITSDGILKIKTAGTVTISATAKDGSKKVGSFKIRFLKYSSSVKYRAVLVGNTYPNTSNYLPGPDNDIAAMKKMLARHKATKYTVTSKKNVTASQIISAVNSAFANADSNDVSLFYYSGHGTSSGSLCGTKNTYISVSNLSTLLDNVPGRKIVLLDSCFSGAHLGTRSKAALKAAEDSFNEAVVAAFEAKDKANYQMKTLVKGENGDVEVVDKVYGSDYCVISACTAYETSASMGVRINGRVYYFGGLTYGLCVSGGYDMVTKKNLKFWADQGYKGNYDGKHSLYETFYAAGSVVYDNLGLDQNTSMYPKANNNVTLWGYK